MNKLINKNKFMIILLIILMITNYLVPITSLANDNCTLGEDIKLTGYGMVPSHVRNSESGDYAMATHLVRVL